MPSRSTLPNDSSNWNLPPTSSNWNLPPKFSTINITTSYGTKHWKHNPGGGHPIFSPKRIMTSFWRSRDWDAEKLKAHRFQIGCSVRDPWRSDRSLQPIKHQRAENCSPSLSYDWFLMKQRAINVGSHFHSTHHSPMRNPHWRRR